MSRKTFISMLLTLIISLSACAGQESTPLLPTALPATTNVPVATEPPAAPAPQTDTLGEDATGSSYDYDYGYENDSSATDGEVPVTGGADIKSQDGSLGTMLVDADGKTLYIFLKDTQNANTSACSGNCADNWPALTDATAGEGIDAALLGSFQRGDGSKQVTYNGWPLYYFVQDSNPGDVNGQGIGGNWYVISPAGEVIK